MKISNLHKCLTSSTDSKVLENLLGQNWRSVLNFWLWVETLNSEQIEEVSVRNEFLSKDRRTVDRIARESVNSFISQNILRTNFNILTRGYSYGTITFASLELSGMHKILDDGNEFTFLPMFDGL